MTLMAPTVLSTSSTGTQDHAVKMKTLKVGKALRKPVQVILKDKLISKVRPQASR